MIPAEFRASGFVDFLAADTNWVTALKAVREDEFFLDVQALILPADNVTIAAGGSFGTRYDVKFGQPDSTNHSESNSRRSSSHEFTRRTCVRTSTCSRMSSSVGWN